MQSLLGTHWRTTLLGILGLVGIVAHTGQALLQGQPIDWSSVFTQVMLSIAVIRSADAANVPAPPAPK